MIISKCAFKIQDKFIQNFLFKLFRSPDFGDLSSSDMCAAIFCSSGTTGVQKAVKFSHAVLIDSTKAG